MKLYPFQAEGAAMLASRRRAQQRRGMRINIEYSDGTNRFFVVSDKLDKKVKDGEMISLITQHPDFSETFIVTTKPATS